jgi:hypothetical protein
MTSTLIVYILGIGFFGNQDNVHAWTIGAFRNFCMGRTPLFEICVSMLRVFRSFGESSLMIPPLPGCSIKGGAGMVVALVSCAKGNRTT